jgi:hypothetical protein
MINAETSAESNTLIRCFDDKGIDAWLCFHAIDM